MGTGSSRWEVGQMERGGKYEHIVGRTKNLSVLFQPDWCLIICAGILAVLIGITSNR